MKLLKFWIYVMTPGTIVNVCMFLLYTSLETFLMIEAMLVFVQTVVMIMYAKLNPKEKKVTA